MRRSRRPSSIVTVLRRKSSSALWGILGIALASAVPSTLAQGLPATAGQTLSGKRIVLAEVLRGRSAVLVAGFSREGGSGTGDWVKALHADPTLNGAAVYQIAQIAGAPGLIRGMIRSGMKKGTAPAQQDTFVVLTDDEKAWKEFFAVTTDKEPYVLVLDATGKVLWRGHGPASMEPQVRASLR